MVVKLVTACVEKGERYWYGGLWNNLTAMGNHILYGITECYLPPGRGDFFVSTPAEAGTRFSDPEGMQI